MTTDLAPRDCIVATIVGRIINEAIPDISRSGSPFVRFRLRVEERDRTTMVAALAFADLIPLAETLREGDRVRVTGRLQVRRFVTDGGEKQGVTIYASTVEPVGIAAATAQA